MASKQDSQKVANAKDEGSAQLSNRSTGENAAMKRPQDASASSSSKRQKIRNASAHHNSCKDDSCEGCSSGEVEICFTGEPGSGPEAATPSAADLYRMALEERDVLAKRTNTVQRQAEDFVEEENQEDLDTRRQAITKLFEMAIEKFETDTKIPVRIDFVKKQEVWPDQNKTASSNELSLQLVFASCLLDFGCFLPHTTYIQRSIDLFKDCLRQVEGAGSKVNSASWGAISAQLGLGRAQMELLRCRYAEISDSDDEGHDLGEEARGSLVPEEAGLTESAKVAFAKGLASVESDTELYVLQCISAARQFREHADILRRFSSTDTTTTKMVSSARTALGFLNKAETANAAFVRSSAEASGIQGTCLYYLAQQISHQDAESPEALKLAKDAEATLKLALAVWERKGAEDIKEGVGYLHILGQVDILLSTLESDESKAISYFDDSITHLRRAYQLDPGNTDIEEQLETMGVLDEEDGDEDEDGEDGEDDE